jgi:MYXO-CTERM domain-containing protein
VTKGVALSSSSKEGNEMKNRKTLRVDERDGRSSSPLSLSEFGAVLGFVAQRRGRATRLVGRATEPQGTSSNASATCRTCGAGWASRVLLWLAVVLLGCGVDISGSERPFAGPASAELSTSGATQIPSALKASYIAARQWDGREPYRFEPSPSGGATGRNEAHRVDVALRDGAIDMTSASDDAWHLGLRWTGFGRGSKVAPVGRPVGEAEVVENRASYRRADGSEERYESGPLGVEQSFVLAAPPAGANGEALTVEVKVEGDVAPVLVTGGAGLALRDANGATVARYTDLAAFDADDVERRSWFEVSGDVVRLRVDDDGARYPLRIDPLMWTQQAELTASDGAARDGFGFSVSVSGGTAILGAPGPVVGSNVRVGKAYVFVQSGSAWTQQAEFTASDAQVGDGFGSSVSVSDGIAIVGAYDHQVQGPTGVVGFGATYVFVQGGTTWTQQAELTASDYTFNDVFGSSVSVSGSTAIIGAPGHQVGSTPSAGAAYVFGQSGTTWTQQAEITASDAAAYDAFGSSVSLSGGTAIVGAPSAVSPGCLSPASAGAAYVFVQNGLIWVQQAKVTASAPAAGDDFGASVSVSGGTAIVGATGPAAPEPGNPVVSAAYVFTQSGTTWTEQAKLSDGEVGDAFGASVAVSGDAAIVGSGTGAAYVFVQDGTTWTQQVELTACDFSSVSVNGGTAVVGAAGNLGAGAAYVFEFCAFSGAAYASGTTNPANNCQVCAPSTSTTAWSNQSDGSTCANACTTGGTCQSGICTGSTPVPDGTACNGGICTAGACGPVADGGTDAGGGGESGSGTTTSSSSSGSSSATTSSGSGGASTGTTNSGNSSPNAGASGSGCACATTPASSPPLGLAAVGALLGFVARRRGRQRDRWPAGVVRGSGALFQPRGR